MAAHSGEQADAVVGMAVPASEREAWALAASVAQEGLWYYDLRHEVVRLSPRALDLLGYAGNAAPSSPRELLRHVSGVDVGVLASAFARLRSGERTRLDMELRLLTVGGETRWALLRARARRGDDGVVHLIAGAVTNIDHRKRAEIQLRDDVHRDPLTGLPNRAALLSFLAARLARAATTPEPRFGLLYFDLDRFKLVNDGLGHAAGDDVLIAVATRVSESVGPRDILARLGGDEFVLVVDEVSGERDLTDLAQRLHEMMREPVASGGRLLPVSLSVGITTSEPLPVKATDMLRDADVAMYEAKRRGGARTVVFDEGMRRAMLERLRVQTDLQRALQREEFRLAYQPIFDLHERRLCGFEALVRWQHPTRGRLTASEFVEIANDCGMIVPIGRWVLDEVCAQLADWRREYPSACPMSLAVNLCDRELLDPDFAAYVEDTLYRHDVPPSCLVLEMTEGAMTAAAQAIPALRRLRDRGVQIQMDDFGRGYSSLSALRRLPLSAIKIDRSFVAGVAVDEESRAIIATILAFARALGLDVICEGVETREQARALAALGNFRYVQGHHFGAPDGEDAVEALLDGADGLDAGRGAAPVGVAPVELADAPPAAGAADAADRPARAPRRTEPLRRRAAGDDRDASA